MKPGTNTKAVLTVIALLLAVIAYKTVIRRETTASAQRAPVAGVGFSNANGAAQQTSAATQQPSGNALLVRSANGSSLWRGTVEGENTVGPGGYRMLRDNLYLRFYSDGTVIGAMSTGTPAQIASWFNAPYTTSGHYSISGSSVKFSVIKNSEDGRFDYAGVVHGSSLQFKVFSHIKGSPLTENYELVPDENEGH